MPAEKRFNLHSIPDRLALEAAHVKGYMSRNFAGGWGIVLTGLAV